jgi:predicted acetyltransferase
VAPRTVHQVTATEAPATERPVLDRLLQLYLHDFSEHAPLGSPHGEVDGDGLFAYLPGIGSYWQEPNCVPLLMRADGCLAGFALVNQWSALERPLDHAVAEFFVVRKYRRAAVGTRAAEHMFRRYPGRWEVPVAGYNEEALLFWRPAVRSMAQVTEHAGDGRHRVVLRHRTRRMSDQITTTEVRQEGFYWVILGQNPPEIAYWEREEWWLAGDPKPWQPEAVTVASDRLVFKPRLAPVA